MLFMFCGIDLLIVQCVVWEFVQVELVDYKYVMVLYDYQVNLYVYISVCVVFRLGKCLNLCKNDLYCWCEIFVEKLRGYGVEVEVIW